MGGEVRILVEGSEVGPHPEVLSLNTGFRSDVPLLKLQVDIDWNPPHPAAALAALEERLEEFCPGLRLHQCRGQLQYRILRSGQQLNGGQEPIEAALALAHLLEHVMIDTLAAITSTPLLSGITGAHRDSARRFDIFVECPDPSLASLVVRLTVLWLSASLDGASLDAGGRLTVELVRLLYERSSEGLSIEEIARHVRGEPAEMRRALHWLEQNGFAYKAPSRVSPRGRQRYRLQVS